ncbi:MAG: alpha/beta fold hydrolase [Pseudomonadota bacterium]
MTMMMIQSGFSQAPRLAAAALAAVSLLVAWGGASAADAPYPAPVEGDYVIDAFEFQSGETLDELRQHYRTIGTLKKDAQGRATNAVLIMHGTTGSGAGFLQERFANVLFAPGGALDAREHFIILPDGIGHGASSKPSDGLRMRFPKYTYDDMIKAQHRLLTEHLGVDRLRLMMGTSMGGMHAWVWGYTYPDFVEALMPLASLPVEIAGRNRMQRKMIIDAIMSDPDWKGGDYGQKPMRGMRMATFPLIFMVSSPYQYQQRAPTRQEAETYLDELASRYADRLEPNDTIYAFDASRNYNPSPHLSKITAPLIAINSADDQVNPPELGILEREIKKIEGAKAIVLPITPETSGHGTHTSAAIWEAHLRALLKESSAAAR